MRNIGRSGLLFGLIVCLCCCVEVESVFCSNGAGYCDDYSSYIRCYINYSDTQLVKELLKGCSNRSTDYNRILVYKDYVSDVSSSLRIDIELPLNIRSLEIRNYKDDDHIRITTFIVNTALTHIYISAHIELETKDVLDYFTHLQSLQLEYLLLRKPPSLKKLQYLNFLSIRLVGPETHLFDDTIVSGLSRLSVLNLHSSYFNGITKGAFRNLNQLTHLDIGDNKITYIEDGVLEDLTNLRKLDLSKNGLGNVSNNAFEGLTKLTYLSVSQNPGFPINALLQTRNLERIYAYYNEYQTLDPHVFQQMKSLTYLGLSDPFRCDCMLQWTSILWEYGITIGWAPYCYQPSIFQQKYIYEPSVYSNCSQTQTYQCFNKSITCPGNQVCYNTNDSFTCDCPIGFELTSQGNCIDINECKKVRNCQHACVNTEGSYSCICDKGYQLASNGYDCDDVNECQEWNGGCEHGCGNIIGSYQCYCEDGHSLKNETHCEEGIECELIEISYIDKRLSSYICKGGYNLTISGLSQTNIQTTNHTESGSTILFITLIGIALLMNVVLVTVIITLSTCIFRKNKKEKKGPANTKVAEIQAIPHNKELLYDTIDESTIPPRPSDILVTHNYQNYPGRAKEDNVVYINID